MNSRSHIQRITRVYWGLGFGSVIALMPTASLSLPTPDLPSPDPERAIRFVCSTSEETPATIAQTATGDIPIVYWNAEFGTDEQMKQEQCETVSQRFQTFYENGELNYLSTGFDSESKKTFVCVAELVVDNEGNEQPRCIGNLFALNSNSSSRASLQRVLRIRVPSDGPISETGGRTYIQWDKFLNGGYPPLTQRRDPLNLKPPLNEQPDDR